MKIEAKTPEDYISKLPEERKEAITKLREEINKNINNGFHEEINYGMIGWVVPHSVYPDGYHCTPTDPLPFMNIASQKNHIAVYHMGIYSDEKVLNWFKDEYQKVAKVKLNMGKSCIRFKKPEHIPYELIGKLAGRMTAQHWIDIYEKTHKK
jgi:uncharacterized protein YdhG (YjbR/CyaY superfamily)